MLKNAVNFLACTILASTLVLTQGLLGGSPLLSNDGVAVALTKAEKAAKKAAKKAAPEAAEEAAEEKPAAEEASGKESSAAEEPPAAE